MSFRERETDYLREEVVLLCNLVQHLMGFNSRPNISFQHLHCIMYGHMDKFTKIISVVLQRGDTGHKVMYRDMQHHLR